MLPLLDVPWFLVPIDVVNGLRWPAPRRPLNDKDLEAVLRRTRAGYHRVVAGLAAEGNNVIMDYPLSEPWRLAHLLEVLAGYEVTLVHVTASPAALDAREQQRGDRPRGLAVLITDVRYGVPAGR